MASPSQKRSARQSVERLPVVSAPDAYLIASWWWMAKELGPLYFRAGQVGKLRKGRCGGVLQKLGFDQRTALDVRQVFWSFWRAHQVLAPKKIRKMHPQYDLWCKATISGVLERVRIWEGKGKVVAIGGQWPYTVAVAEDELELRRGTIRRWQGQAEHGEVWHGVPELLDWKVRAQADADRKMVMAKNVQIQAEWAAACEAKRDAASVPAGPVAELEANEAGVTIKAADLSRLPRKALFHAGLDGGCKIEGGELVVLAKYQPHAGQISFHSSGARERWIVAGRRGGKTRCGAEEIIRCALMQRGSYNWIVGPTYPMLDHAQRAVLTDTAVGQVKELTALWLKRERKLHLCNGSLIEFRSAEWEETLRGPGLDNCWVDEVQLLRDAAYKILRAATLETQGRLWGTGTPLGRNWLFPEWSKGADPEWTDVASWRFPSLLNPLVTEEEFERERRGVPEVWFRQEFLAEFVEGVATVFGDLSSCIVHDNFRFAYRPRVVLGLDLGKQKDFTACVAMTSNGQVAETWRTRREGWGKQRASVMEIHAKWRRPPVLADSAGAGDSFIEALQAEGVYVLPIPTNAAVRKNALIEQLMIDIEGGRVWIPESEEVLIAELMQYSRSVTPGGNVSYSAPAGQHDDMVIALALANWGVRRKGLAMDIEQVAVASDMDARSGEPVLPMHVRHGLFDHGNATVLGRVGGLFSGRRKAYDWGDSDDDKPRRGRLIKN